MGDLTIRDVEYSHDGTKMLGAVVAPPGARDLPGVLLLHDAFGLGETMFGFARSLAAAGHPVFAADLWGERRLPDSEAQIGSLIGSLASDRSRWMARVAAAHAAAGNEPEIHSGSLVGLGFCFGGSGALEYLRTGGDLRAVVSIHGGLDLLEPDWGDVKADDARVLICTGADDPMATKEMRTDLEASLSRAGISWETNVYSDTVHAFTNPASRFSPNPAVVGYNPRSAARAWATTLGFLAGTDQLYSAN